MNENPKEVAVFKTYTKNNKLKVLGIAIAIIVACFILLYFPVKTLFTYTVTFHLNGGSIYNQELEKKEYKFLETVEEPQGIKKFGVGADGEEIGYYIDHWSKKEDLSDVYHFGGKIWNSYHLYIDWKLGVAVRLHFADGEENSDMSTLDLKGYYEQYIKPGSDYTLPLMYNDKIDKNRNHYGEQLIWYDNPECTGEGFFTKTYTNLTESIDIYGKWIDTSEDKFEVNSDGELTKYLGYCNKVALPSNVKKIKDMEIDKFDMSYSVWSNVMSGNESSTNLQIVYINKELEYIGDCAFRYCIGLKEVVFPADNNVSHIGAEAFMGCTSLTSFTFPSKVQEINERTFDSAFDKKANVILNLDNIYKIYDGAFQGSKIKGVSLAKITYIGKNAFSSCMNLENFEIKNETPPDSNVNLDLGLTSTNSEGIFSVVNYNMNAILKIIVPKGKIATYKASPYWNMYEKLIVENDN